MNPNRVSTPVNKFVDIWHFLLHAGKRRVVAWDIAIIRNRDIEMEPLVLKFRATLAMNEMDADTKELLVGCPSFLDAESMPELRTQMLEILRRSEAPLWRKVIVVYSKTHSNTDERRDPQNAFNAGKRVEREETEDDIDLRFGWGVGEECQGWYRDKPGYSHPKAWYLLPMSGRGDDTEVHVYEYSPELLLRLESLKQRMEELGRALDRVVSPGELLNAHVWPQLPAPEK